VTVTLIGEIARVTFENEETGFRVLQLAVSEGPERGRRLAVVGTLPSVGPGTRVRATGEIEEDAKHGRRLRASSLVVLDPTTLAGIETFLGSGVIPGLGPGFAGRIVRTFGLDTLSVLDGAAHRLAEVRGLGPQRRQSIAQGWQTHRAQAGVLMALEQAGATPALATRVVKHFGDKALSVVQTAPYRLAAEVAGVGFRTADALARKQGLAMDHPDRIQAGVLHQLGLVADAGHTVSLQGDLLSDAAKLLEVEQRFVEAAIDVLALSGKVVLAEGLVQLDRLHRAERSIAARIAKLLLTPAPAVAQFDQALTAFERARSMSLAPSQRRAVELAARGKLAVITGGPGVGKTTIVQAILAVLAASRLRVALAAPTGRAARRLAETTGKEASTLHRLLEVDPRTGAFQRDADRPLELDLLVIDEASMVDVYLAESLLSALPDEARVVLVGDVDQLPSVGPGAFLKDIIASGAVPVATLDVIFRQAEESGIITSSHRILRGQEPVGSTEATGDFFVIRASDPVRARELLVELVTTRIPRSFDLDPRRDIQVLTPMHRGEVGTTLLNQRLQAALNPTGAERQVGEQVLRVGDKVLQTKNDYERGVFNGDLGEVMKVDSELGTLTVRFEGDRGASEHVYAGPELFQLSLAYATTIHKSQGSEYPAVVVPLCMGHFTMLSRNLLYTAVTRAKRLCVLLVEGKALRIALNETRRELRRTRLGAQLARALAAEADNVS
jgi:exodeoxyribonuclease V alpha subunit